jgi:hypothetical protein
MILAGVALAIACFDSDVSLQPRVAGAMDFAHGAFSKQ